MQHIGYSAQLKYLLVVLQPRFCGKQLAAVKPDVAAMGEAVPASEVTGVIVAAAASPGRFLPQTLVWALGTFWDQECEAWSLM